MVWCCSVFSFLLVPWLSWAGLGFGRVGEVGGMVLLFFSFSFFFLVFPYLGCVGLGYGGL